MFEVGGYSNCIHSFNIQVLPKTWIKVGETLKN
jgi:hypothetical protein